MPHKCTKCDEMIPNKSEYLLSGCPECNNSSWEYISLTVETNEEQNNNEKLKNSQKSISEDKSQKEARTKFYDAKELPKTENNINEYTNTNKINDITQIKEQLNKQYEGIKIVRNGKYKINLTELYRGNDYIIDIGNDGSYEVSKL